ncbi:MAG: hypothetical protein JXR71_00685 [Bacteroidales bacterium]|nr:hypothetical protein [Bacteroidales bacterium]
MKTYTFPMMRKKRMLFIAFSTLLFFFALAGFLAAYTHNVNLATAVYIIPLALVLYYLRKSRPREESVTITEKGFFIQSSNRNIYWDEIAWYKNYATSGSITDNFNLGIKNGKNVHFNLHKNSPYPGDWTAFKTDLMDAVKEHCPGIRSYYDSKVWRTVMIVIVIFWFVGPAIMIQLHETLSQIAASSIIFIGGTMPLVNTIRKNSRKKPL